MTWILRTSGVASIATICIAVSDAGNVVKDYTTNNSYTVGTSVSIGTGTWKGTTRPFFEVKTSSGFDYYGVAYTSTPGHPLPSNFMNSGMCFFGAFNTYSSGAILLFDTNGDGIRVDSDGRPGFYNSAVFRLKGTTTLATGQKFAMGGSYRASVAPGPFGEWWYALESASTIAQDGVSVSVSGLGSNNGVTGVGGQSGQGHFSSKCHLFFLGNRALTSAEASQLYNDPFGTLFTSAGEAPPPTSPSTALLYVKANKLIGGGMIQL